MDSSVIILIILGTIVAFLLGLYLFVKFGPKGLVGESFVYFVFRVGLNKKKYFIFNNVVLLDGEKSVQIDHIIVSKFGIFVIETKNYSGKIYGNEYSTNFTQYLGKQKNSFYSPIKQNSSHINSLRRVVGDFPYTSVIVFLAHSTLRVSSDTFVGTPSKALSLIKKSKTTVLSESEVVNFIIKLNEVNQSSSISKKKHVANINANIDKYSIAKETMICPWCGSKLIKRNGKYGEFIGCSNYPKCKFILKQN